MIDFISNILQSYNLYMKEIFGNQQFLISTVTMIIVGILGVIIKYVPEFLFYQFRKFLTITIRIDSTHESYHNIMKNLFENDLIYKSKFFNIRNGRWGYEPAQLQLGEGVQFFWIKGIPILIYVKSQEIKDDMLFYVTFTTFIGFGKKLLNILLENAKIDRYEIDKTRIVKIDRNERVVIYQRKETLENKVLTKSAKQAVKIIKEFLNKKDFYFKKGLTYKTGILMYGLPGTGKTSLIRSIAGEFDLDIYLIKSIADLEKALYVESSENEKTRIIVIEEIDNYSVNRENQEEKDGNDMGKLLAEINLGELLQQLDGIIQADNVIIIGTTNHIERIDKALLRPGRFDHLIEFGYIDEDEFNDFLKFYFDKDLREQNIKIKKITPAELQKEFLQGSSFEEFIKKFVENYDELTIEIELSKETIENNKIKVIDKK